MLLFKDGLFLCQVLEVMRVFPVCFAFVHCCVLLPVVGVVFQLVLVKCSEVFVNALSLLTMSLLQFYLTRTRANFFAGNINKYFLHGL